MAFLQSMIGRIFVLLTGGMLFSVTVSLVFSEHARSRDIERQQRDAIIASAVDIANTFNRDGDIVADELRNGMFIGSHLAPPDAKITPDPELGARFAQHFPTFKGISIGRVPRSYCQQGIVWGRRLVAGLRESPIFCSIVTYREPSGKKRSFTVDFAGLNIPPNSLLNPLFFILFFAASAVLAIFTSRWVAGPIRHLERAARTFSVAFDLEMLPETGPSEVRAALATFNLMQNRVKNGFLERTQMLASISHDLQTPLTRLRLRLEKVEDAALRARLIDDLIATQTLVAQGLELARSSENSEEWCWVDLDSAMASLAEDANEFGTCVDYRHQCQVTARVKPSALARCLGNLIDNAVKYAGAAELLCVSEGGAYHILIRDRGPGIPAEYLEKVFEPFVRVSGNGQPIAPGTGIGLSIARAQAATFGASVELEHRPGGGLVARLRLSPAAGLRSCAWSPNSRESTLAAVR